MLKYNHILKNRASLSRSGRLGLLETAMPTRGIIPSGRDGAGRFGLLARHQKPRFKEQRGKWRETGM